LGKSSRELRSGRSSIPTESTDFPVRPKLPGGKKVDKTPLAAWRLAEARRYNPPHFRT
jgi:hypothetical protein